jgi:lipoate-protein ligase A
MLFVDNGGVTDAHYNLALEEYVLRNKLGQEDALLFYVNEPAIIIGRNQNTIEEIDPDVVAAREIRVVRRVSGGGAVYHDLGNLNFSFMTRDVSGRFNRYDKFNGPVVEVLRSLGVPAEIGGRNDILVEGRKISGNAQFATHDRMFSHGTLLLDSDLDHITAALRPRPGKVESKGMKSIRSRVANIREFLGAPLDVEELRDLILERIFGTRDRSRIPSIPLDDADHRAIAELLEKKYRTWEWNYGQNPPANVERSHRFPAGEIDVRLFIEDGRIRSIRIFGDFMGQRDVHAIEERLLGLPYDAPAITDALSDLDLSLYFGAIPADEAMRLVKP